MNDNLQRVIDDASRKATEVLIAEPSPTEEVQKLCGAIYDLCIALEIVKQEFQYYQKR